MRCKLSCLIILIKITRFSLNAISMRVHELGITWFLDRSFTESRIDITDDIIADEIYDEKSSNNN